MSTQTATVRITPIVPPGTWIVDPTHSNVEFAVKHTSDEQRDAHLRSADFFDVDKYPEITFESTRVEAIDEESPQVFGNLRSPVS